MDFFRKLFPDQFLSTTFYTILATVLWSFYKDWRGRRRRIQAVGEGEEDEQRDWRMRCLRTQADLEALDSFVERLKSKTEIVQPILQKALTMLEDKDTKREDGTLKTQEEILKDRCVTAEILRYVMSERLMEFAVHSEERPGYLERLRAPLPSRPSLPRVEPPEEEIINLPGVPK